MVKSRKNKYSKYNSKMVMRKFKKIFLDNSKAIIPGGGLSAHRKATAPITKIQKQTLKMVDFIPNT